MSRKQYVVQMQAVLSKLAVDFPGKCETSNFFGHFQEEHEVCAGEERRGERGEERRGEERRGEERNFFYF